MNPDPAIFVIDLQDANKKLFSAYYFLKVHIRPFSKIKIKMSSHKIAGIKVFLAIVA
jgi:hypothetical protein